MPHFRDPEVHLLFSSGEESEVATLTQMLEQHPAVRVSAVRQGPLLKGWVELPFIEATTGERIVGLDGIADFLKEQQPSQSKAMPPRAPNA